MIGYLEGKTIYKSAGKVIINAGGVGYEVTCSSAVYNALKEGENGSVFVYTALREDGIFLYGFKSVAEKEMFLKLISVSGVGPKMGITILSNMLLEDIAVKIATSDVKGLSSIKGLGKKTAERIILELRERITAEEYEEGEIKNPQKEEEPDNQDAIIALMSLGFTKQECINALKGASTSGATTVEEVVTYALRHIR